MACDATERDHASGEPQRISDVVGANHDRVSDRLHHFTALRVRELAHPFVKRDCELCSPLVAVSARELGEAAQVGEQEGVRAHVRITARPSDM